MCQKQTFQYLDKDNTMTSKINALSTGVGGIATTADASGILEIQTNDTTAMTVDGSQVVSFDNNFGTVAGLPSYQCRAWVNFNGTGTVAIRASGNVSGITDNGTGLFTINLTTAMPDANYCATISAGSGAGASGDGTAYRNNIAAGSFQVETFNGAGTAAVDYAYVGVAVFR
jgi:hypothetical protein